MLRRCTVLLFVTMCMLALAGVTAEAGQYYDYMQHIKLTVNSRNALVNGEPVTMDHAAYVKNGRTLVPFRFLGEALGAEVNWEENKKQAVLQLNQTDVRVAVGSKVARVNEKLISLEVPAEIKGGRIFIPLRFVAESLGAQVNYDKATNTVTVIGIDTSEWRELKNPDTGEVIFIYPNDWAARVVEDTDVVDIVTLHGSEAVVSVIEGTSFADVVNEAKEEYSADFQLVSQEYVNKNNPADGIWLTFCEKEPQDKNNPLYDKLFFCVKEDGDIFSVDETMSARDIFCDEPVFYKIIFCGPANNIPF